MAWVRIHDDAMSHPKIVGLSDKAFRLWIWGLSYAQRHLTDGCVTADAMSHFAFLYRDAQARAIEMMAPSDHPSFGGRYWRYAPLLGFSTTPGRGGSFCEMGEHTRAILEELGYDAAATAELNETGVVTWPDDPS